MIVIGSYFVFIMFVIGTICEIPEFSQEELNEFFKAILKEHNAYRRTHDSNSVKLSERMKKLALEAVHDYANFNIKKPQGYNYNKTPFYTSSKLNKNLAKEIVEDWYNTDADINPDRLPTLNMSDPFTQIIWKETIKIGTAIVWKENVLYITVCYSGTLES